MPRSRRGARGHARRNPVGIVHITSGGYGFVDTPEGEFFVPARKMGGAFDGDTVEVKPVSVNHGHRQPRKEHHEVGKNPTGRVVNVLVRAHETLVGRYEVAEPFGVVVPSDSRIQHDIFTLHADNPYVKDGDMVRVRITQYPARNVAALGVVEEVVGRAGAPGSDIDALVAAHRLRVDFPEEALREAEKAQVDADEALAQGYADLRSRCVFTIDPADARDYDDALSLDRIGGRWRLGVHIADVSWYVRPGTAADDEARLRATSVYLVDRVIPMLPEALSNGVCSLAPGVDRRCLTADIVLDDEARVLEVAFFPSIIRSAARLDYGQVQAYLEGRGSDSGIPPEVRERISGLDRIAQRLKQRRLAAGALDLESAEAHVLLDGEGVPTGVVVRRATRATELVEQCMVLANALVAAHLAERGEPALFRVHEAPDPGQLEQLVPLLQEFGYTRKVNPAAFAAGNPHALQKVLEISRARRESQLVSLLLLRSLKRAVYASRCEPHFGLALDEYLHFTSPIRRYPDLVAHRALKRSLGVPGFEKDVRGDALKALADHASAMERAADEAALQSQTMKLVEYLEGFVGEDFEGIICRVASFGFFVQLDNTATGLVPLGMGGGEPFSLDVRRQTLTGQESGVVYRLGQRVRVRLKAARPSQRELDFDLVPDSLR